ncbi:NUDIX domain-containing protein [Candidatus Woesearchaeota archaeon]|nr:NUDIX domain-containing protein [Candidatus Woesearchaeota archaeon]
MNKQPRISVDVIVRYKNGIVLIKRKNPPIGWALPGGFVEYNESLEDAARRETKEETNLALSSLKQMKAYSEPDRDPRGHTITIAFTAEGTGELRSGDDARSAEIFPADAMPNLVFDHNKIIDDALKKYG